jgi:hypothetical protein
MYCLFLSAGDSMQEFSKQSEMANIKRNQEKRYSGHFLPFGVCLLPL